MSSKMPYNLNIFIHVNFGTLQSVYPLRYSTTALDIAKNCKIMIALYFQNIFLYFLFWKPLI